MLVAGCLWWIVNINSQYCFLNFFFNWNFELSGDCPCDIIKLSSPSLLFAEGNVEEEKRMNHLLLCRVHLAAASWKVSAVSLMVLSCISVDSIAVVADIDGLRLLLHFIFSSTSILGSLGCQDCIWHGKEKGRRGQHEYCHQLRSHAFPACSDHKF